MAAVGVLGLVQGLGQQLEAEFLSLTLSPALNQLGRGHWVFLHLPTPFRCARGAWSSPALHKDRPQRAGTRPPRPESPFTRSFCPLI